MRNTPRLRLCERCWGLIPPRTACKVTRHTDPARPFLAALRSYEHLDGDPTCVTAANRDSAPQQHH